MKKYCLKFISSKLPNSAIQWFVLFLGISPLFIMAIQGWMNRILFVTFGLSVYILIQEKTTHLIKDNNIKKWIFWFIVALASPIVGIFLGQLFRHEFSWSSYDSPTRLLVCIPILIVMVKYKINLAKLFTYSIPSTIFITGIAVLIKPSELWMALGKLTTYCINPITFGYLCITLSLLSFICIDFSKSSSRLLASVQLLAVVTGAFLSVLSLSRTGWIAVPIVLLLWLTYSEFKRRYLIVTLTILATIILSLAIYQSSSKVQDRIDHAVNESLNYQWNGENPVTSVGDRISFTRIAVFLFKQKPFSGWGDHGFASEINKPELEFAALSTKETALNAGFHNIITASAVKSGIWGLISIITIFLIPGLLYCKGLKSKSIPTRKLALLSLSFVICEFISGMTMEIFDLKYTSAFYGMMITVFSGSLLVAMQSEDDKVQ